MFFHVGVVDGCTCARQSHGQQKIGLHRHARLYHSKKLVMVMTGTYMMAAPMLSLHQIHRMIKLVQMNVLFSTIWLATDEQQDASDQVCDEHGYEEQPDSVYGGLLSVKAQE